MRQSSQSPRPEPGSEPKILTIEQVAKELRALITPLSEARIVFSGFCLPEEFGGASELEYGNAEQMKAQGLAGAATEMGKGFVLNTIEELFSGDLEMPFSEGDLFQLVQEKGGLITVTLLPPESASSKD
ncbi:MAG: hypothetical protein ACE5FZ_05635 [Nitrospiria bacterium]